MDIEGFGEEIIKDVVEADLVESLADIYQLTLDDLEDSPPLDAGRTAKPASSNGRRSCSRTSK